MKHVTSTSGIGNGRSAAFVKSVLLSFAMMSVGWAQPGPPEGAPVQVSPLPFYRPVYTLQFFDGSNRLEYICRAYSASSNGTFSVSSATAANPGVFTSASHGLFVTNVTNRPKVVISGGTGNWAAANGTWVAIPISTTTFSLLDSAGTALNTTGFGALAGTVVMSTSAPRINDYIWFLTKLVYDGTGNNPAIMSGLDFSRGFGRARCDQRTTDGVIEWR